MLAEVTAATQLLIVCNPNNPTATHLPAARIAELLERVPGHVTVIVDEAYVEFQLDDDPDATVDLRRDVPEPGPAADLLARSTGSPACGSATRSCSPAFRAAVDAVRQPFSVNARRPGRRRGGDPPLRRRRCSGSSARSSSGSWSRRACASSAWRRPTRRPTSPGSTLGDRDEAEIVAALGEQGIVVRAGERRSAAPATSGSATATREQNQRFLDALAERSERRHSPLAEKCW